MALPLALLPYVRQQFLDGDGVPYADGYLKFFEAGTSTPLEVFADSDGATSLGVQVTLDSDGSAVSIYVSPTGYKVQLFDVNDVQIWEQDNVEDVGSAFLATLGNVLAEGSRSVVTGYTVTADDNLITVDEPSTDPAILNLQASADRGLPLTVQNQGTTDVAITPNGAETINGLASAFTLPAASSPTFPTVVLLPDGVSGYFVIAGWGLV